MRFAHDLTRVKREYATTPRAGESARVGVRKRVVLVWYTTHAAVEYRDGNRALVAKDKVTRAKFSMTEEQWQRYAYACNCYRGGARQLRYELRKYMSSSTVRRSSSRPARLNLCRYPR